MALLEYTMADTLNLGGAAPLPGIAAVPYIPPPALWMTPGIYICSNVGTNRYYVGKSVNIGERWRERFAAVRELGLAPATAAQIDLCSFTVRTANTGGAPAAVAAGVLAAALPIAMIDGVAINLEWWLLRAAQRGDLGGVTNVTGNVAGWVMNNLVVPGGIGAGLIWGGAAPLNVQINMFLNGMFAGAPVVIAPGGVY